MAIIWFIFIIFPCHCAVYMYKIMILQKPLSQFPPNFTLILLLKCDYSLFKWSCSIDCQAHIFFFKTKNCSNDDIFISCDDRIGKLLHNSCMSAVAMSLRWANHGPWASCSSNHHESCSTCLSWWFLGQVWNGVTWGKKLGHLAKSAENLVNTLPATFLKQSSWILLKLFVLMISRSSLKLGHMGSKTRWPGQISRKLLTLQRSHFLNNHHKYCSKCLSWWFLGLV